MSEKKELNIEELEKVSGGELTQDMLTAYAKMKKEADTEYQNWLLTNLGATSKEKEAKYNECLNNAYNNLGLIDKNLVDSYYQQIQSKAVFPA